jgi:hypothetical protein
MSGRAGLSCCLAAWTFLLKTCDLLCVCKSGEIGKILLATYLSVMISDERPQRVIRVTWGSSCSFVWNCCAYVRSIRTDFVSPEGRTVLMHGSNTIRQALALYCLIRNLGKISWTSLASSATANTYYQARRVVHALGRQRGPI